MVEIPNDAKLLAYCTTGSILHIQNLPLSEDFKKNKYVIVLNNLNDSNDIFYAIATSKTARFNNLTQFEPFILRIEEGASRFPKETIIDLTDIRMALKDNFLGLLALNELEYIDHLPEDIVKQMIAIIQTSIYVSTQVRESIS